MLSAIKNQPGTGRKKQDAFYLKSYLTTFDANIQWEIGEKYTVLYVFI